MNYWVPILSLAAAAIPAILMAQPVDSAPVVSIRDGRIAGKSFLGGSVYFNIPYAAPPIGELRWKRPLPPAGWAEVRDGTQRGAACMQPDQHWNSVDAARSSEDCLYLNIWRQKGNKPHAVMVWFHGGAFIGGAGNTPLYDGEALARRGIVLVTVNYRLGVFGYLTHPELSAQDAHGKSGNYGLMDQIEALRWVKRNIASFGGDPANVTIFGQSAGAASVASLMAAPATKGLFQRAILQSGAPFRPMLGTTQRLDAVQSANAGFGQIAELKRVSAEEVMSRWANFTKDRGLGLLLSPVVDGEVLVAAPGDALIEGAARGISVIVGSNSREMPSPLPPDQLRDSARYAFGPRADAILRGFAARADQVRYGPVADQLSTELSFGCGVTRTAQSVRRAWAYTFAQPSPGEIMVRHSAEVSYVFGVAGNDGGVLTLRPFDLKELGLSALLQAYWTNFAKRGDPNGPSLPLWPQYRPKTQMGVVFNNGWVMRQSLNSAACDAVPGVVSEGVVDKRLQP